MTEPLKVEIQDLDTLEALLSRSEISVHFEVPSGVNCDEDTMSSAIVFSVGSESVADSRFVTNLKQEVASAVGPIPREISTTLVADGTLAIGRLGDSKLLEVNLDYREVPEVDGSNSGSLFGVLNLAEESEQ